MFIAQVVQCWDGWGHRCDRHAVACSCLISRCWSSKHCFALTSSGLRTSVLILGGFGVFLSISRGCSTDFWWQDVALRSKETLWPCKQWQKAHTVIWVAVSSCTLWHKTVVYFNISIVWDLLLKNELWLTLTLHTVDISGVSTLPWLWDAIRSVPVGTPESSNS